MKQVKFSQNFGKRILATVALWGVAAAVAIAAMTWRMDAATSKLSFVGKQAGAEFEGRFEKFTADIRFDAKDLAGSHFDVVIDLASVNSKDKERDDTLRSEDLFSSKRWPTAHFVAETFTQKAPGKFAATGKLTIRDQTRPQSIEFSFEPDAQGKTAALKGSAQLKRLDFGVGQGDWKSTEWVANEVRVDFALKLTL
jgi:polyisoprenoid-binding protein YceI